MSVRSTPELVVYAHDEIERLAKALVLSWHNDPAYNWDPDNPLNGERPAIGDLSAHG